MLIGGPGEALLVLDHFQVYLEMSEGIDLIPIVVGAGAEFASLSPGSGEFMASEDIANGVLPGSRGKGGEFKAMLLPDMIGQREAAKVGEFPFFEHQLLYLFLRLARRALGPSGEVLQRESWPLSMDELLHRISGAVKGVSGTQHIASHLFEGSKEDLPGL